MPPPNYDRRQLAEQQAGVVVRRGPALGVPAIRDLVAAVRHRLEPEPEQKRLEQLRAHHIAELEALDGPGWNRTGRHGEQGEMSIELYETHVAAEEVDHLAHITRLL